MEQQPPNYRRKAKDVLGEQYKKVLVEGIEDKVKEYKDKGYTENSRDKNSIILSKIHGDKIETICVDKKTGEVKSNTDKTGATFSDIN